MLLRNLDLTMLVIHSFIFCLLGTKPNQVEVSGWLWIWNQPFFPWCTGKKTRHCPSMLSDGRQLQASLWMHPSQFHCQKLQGHHANAKRSHSITWPLTGAVSAICDSITPNFNDNHFIASDSLGLPFKRGSARWLISALCGVSLGGSSMNEGSKMASPHVWQLVLPVTRGA